MSIENPQNTTKESVWYFCFVRQATSAMLCFDNGGGLDSSPTQPTDGISASYPNALSRDMEFWDQVESA